MYKKGLLQELKIIGVFFDTFNWRIFMRKPGWIATDLLNKIEWEKETVSRIGRITRKCYSNCIICMIFLLHFNLLDRRKRAEWIRQRFYTSCWNLHLQQSNWLLDASSKHCIILYAHATIVFVRLSVQRNGKHNEISLKIEESMTFGFQPWGNMNEVIRLTYFCQRIPFWLDSSSFHSR